MQNNMSAPQEVISSEGNVRFDFPWWKPFRLGKIALRKGEVAQKITNGCGPTNRMRRPTFAVWSLYFSWPRARWTAWFIALMAIIYPAFGWFFMRRKESWNSHNSSFISGYLTALTKLLRLRRHKICVPKLKRVSNFLARSRDRSELHPSILCAVSQSSGFFYQI